MATIESTSHGTYRVRYRDPSGRSRSRTFKRKLDAANFLHVVEADKLRGDYADPRLGKIKVGDWADQWFGTLGNCSPKTRDHYAFALRNYVIPELGATAVARIDRATVRRFAASITDEFHKSASTRNAALKALRGTLGYALDAGAIKTNPALGLRLPKGSVREKFFLTPAEVTKLADAMRTAQGATMIVFAAYTGMRAGEIEALRARRIVGGKVDVVENLVEDAKGQLHFRPTKNYQRRSVAMPEFLTERMRAHIEGRAPNDLVFPAAEGGPMRHSNWYARHFRPAVARAGLPPQLRFHDLRHTCAAMLIGVGANPRAVMEHLGHSSISMTLGTYGHLYKGWDEELAAGLEQLWKS